MTPRLQDNDDSYHFLQVLFSRLPKESGSGVHRVQRRLALVGMICLCLFDIIYCYLTYQSTAIVPFLGILLILLIYIVLDLATASTNAAAIAAAVGLVPVFLMVLFSGTGGTLTLVWCILIPPLSMMICGLLPGTIVSCFFLAFFYAAFRTGLGDLLPDVYAAEVRAVYPMIYLLTFTLSGVTYFRRFRTSLILYDSTVALEKAHEMAQERSVQLIRETILSLVNTVDARDDYTRAHSTRVAKYAAMLAEQMGWKAERVEELYQAALLHDIGKVGISDTLLRKNEALSPEEYEIVKRHTLIGEEILKDLTVLPRAAVGAAYHHERYDGSGYPRGLKGDEIPLEARIIGIADAFDAMNSARVYRGRMDADSIMKEIACGAGSQFDPELARLFMPIAKQIIDSNQL